MSISPTEPTVSDVEQSEVPDYQTVAVKVETPVNVRTLPAVYGRLQSETITSTAKMLFPADDRRNRACIWCRTGVIWVGDTRLSVDQDLAANLSDSNGILELKHKGEIWVAAESTNVLVSYIAEYWTD